MEPFNICGLSVFRLAIAERIKDTTDNVIEAKTEKRFQNFAVRYQRPCLAFSISSHDLRERGQKGEKELGTRGGVAGSTRFDTSVVPIVLAALDCSGRMQQSPFYQIEIGVG